MHFEKVTFDALLHEMFPQTNMIDESVVFPFHSKTLIQNGLAKSLSYSQCK